MDKAFFTSDFIEPSVNTKADQQHETSRLRMWHAPQYNFCTANYALKKKITRTVNRVSGPAFWTILGLVSE